MQHFRRRDDAVNERENGLRERLGAILRRLKDVIAQIQDHFSPGRPDATGNGAYIHHRLADDVDVRAKSRRVLLPAGEIDHGDGVDVEAAVGEGGCGEGAAEADVDAPGMSARHPAG